MTVPARFRIRAARGWEHLSLSSRQRQLIELAFALVRGVAVPIARFRNNPANAARYGERQLGYARKTMTHYAKDSWSRYVTRS
jgi:hypothetical protein